MTRHRLEGGTRLRGERKSSPPGSPLISVVTVVYNGERHLEQAIRSVLEQGHRNIEYIIVDGGSTDGTLDVVRKHEDRIDYWISEPDRGIYDAMNKGIALCTGDLIGILNCDDRYLPGALDAVARAYKECRNPHSVIGGPWKVVFRDRELGIVTPSLRFHDLRICHQALFVPRAAYETVGPYDTAYRYSADLDMAIRLHLHGFEYLFVELPLVQYRTFGASGKHFRETSREQSRILRKHLPLRSWLRFQAFRLKSQFLIVMFLGMNRVLGEESVSRWASRYFLWKERFRKNG